MASQFQHEPVLLDAVLREATPALEARPNPLIVDGTAGGGGHSAALLDAAGPSARLIAIDRDPEAVQAATENLGRFGERARVVRGSYAELDEILAEGELADLILVDLGLSSHQLDTPERGFSFRHDAPLDMRFDPASSMTAGDLLDELDENELARVLRDYGEVPQPRRVARALRTDRAEGTIQTTRELASLVERVLRPPRKGKIHPATLVFQALRIRTNDELGHLERLLTEAPNYLREGGRLLVISFHSLEDRMAKQAMRYWQNGPYVPGGLPRKPWEPVLRAQGKPRVATDKEAERNPRARSAKLRVAVRTEAPVPADARIW